MPAAARQRDSVLALAALAYMTRVHARPPSRALSPACSRRSSPRNSWSRLALHRRLRSPGPRPRIRPAPAAFWLASAFFALLAWLNCHAIDRWESTPPFALSQPRPFFPRPQPPRARRRHRRRPARLHATPRRALSPPYSARFSSPCSTLSARVSPPSPCAPRPILSSSPPSC